VKEYGVKAKTRPGYPLLRLRNEQGREVRMAGVGRSGPNLKPGTVRVYAIHGSRNGLSTTQHPPSLGYGAGPDLPTNVQAVTRAGITYTRTVPGSRLGPDLPREDIWSTHNKRTHTQTTFTHREIGSASWISSCMPKEHARTRARGFECIV